MAINQYHLHKDDDTKLHFQLKDAQSHIKNNVEHVYKPHRHTYYQMIWFKAAGQHYVDYELYHHPANSLFLLNKGQVHYFCDNARNEGQLLHFDEIFLLKGDQSYNNRIQYELFSEQAEPFLILNQESIEILEKITPLLQKEISTKKYGYREIIFNLLQIIVVQIERQKKIDFGSKKISNESLDIAMNFKTLVLKNIDRFISIEDYAKQMNVSSKKLTSVCKKYLESTPVNVIAQLKILEAKRRLSNSKTSIKEIAYDLGFDQATYFTKYFKKHTTITPKEFIGKWKNI